MNILRPLDIDEIDLSHSAFFEFAQLKGVKVHTINISGCRINSITRSRCQTVMKLGIKKIIFDSRYLEENEVALLKANFITEDTAPGLK